MMFRISDVFPLFSVFPTCVCTMLLLFSRFFIDFKWLRIRFFLSNVFIYNWCVCVCSNNSRRNARWSNRIYVWLWLSIVWLFFYSIFCMIYLRFFGLWMLFTFASVLMSNIPFLPLSLACLLFLSLFLSLSRCQILICRCLMQFFSRYTRHTVSQTFSRNLIKRICWNLFPCRILEEWTKELKSIIDTFSPDDYTTWLIWNYFRLNWLRIDVYAASLTTFERTALLFLLVKIQRKKIFLYFSRWLYLNRNCFYFTFFTKKIRLLHLAK